MYKQLM